MRALGAVSCFIGKNDRCGLGDWGGTERMLSHPSKSAVPEKVLCDYESRRDALQQDRLSGGRGGGVQGFLLNWIGASGSQYLS